MPIDRAFIAEALRHVRAEDGAHAADAVEWVSACDGYAAVKLSGGSFSDEASCAPVASRIHEAVRAQASIKGEALKSLRVEFVDHSGSSIFRVTKGADIPAAAAEKLDEGDPAPERSEVEVKPAEESSSGLPGVKQIIAVGAGKGGVGKSTVSVNLAVSLARRGHAVGLMDGDIYGPSLPTMLGLDALEVVVQEGMIQPFFVHGIKAVTIGKLVEADKPLIWRGPMAHGAFKQLADQSAWGELDYLIIDLPPGTGDVPLTMAQLLGLSGAVVVCTPQRVAQDDAVRAVRMFQQLGIDVLGIVENMSYFVGDDGKEYDIFGRGGAELMAQRLGLPYLGGLPINMALRANSDSGDPSANFDPASAGGDQLPAALGALAERFESQLAMASLKQGRSQPKLSIS